MSGNNIETNILVTTAGVLKINLEFKWLNGKTNVICPVICGVPQGSVLWPLHFKVFMVDIGIFVRSHGLKHHLYADDNQMCISCSPSDATVLRDKL